MAPLTKEQKSEAARRGSETRRLNKIAEQNRAAELESTRKSNINDTKSSSIWNWLLWIVPLTVVVIIVAILWHSWWTANKSAAPTAAPTAALTAARTAAATAAPTAAATAAPTAAATAAPTAAATAAPTAAELNSSMTKVEVPIGPVLVSEPAPTCPSWNPDKEITQFLKPGMTAIGDVVVDGTPQYDNGSGESTIVVNLSSDEVKIYAEWGSGCEYTTDIESVVNKQLFAGCGDANNDGIVDQCNNVRIVLVTDLGTSVTFKKPVAINK